VSWEFNEEKFMDVDQIAMLGSAILVVPFLEEKQESVTVDLPAGVRWFCYRTLAEVATKENLTIPSDFGRTAVFLRGGSIVPVKRTIRKSSTLMFWDPFTLIIAVDGQENAEGELYVDDGESFEYVTGSYIHRTFRFTRNGLTSTNLVPRSRTPFVEKYDVVISQIWITGLSRVPTKITDKSGKELRFVVRDGALLIHRPDLRVADDFELLFAY
jgi:alpha 1,3-glucosidase